MCFGYKTTCRICGGTAVEYIENGKCDDYDESPDSTHHVIGHERFIPACEACIAGELYDQLQQEENYSRNTRTAKRLLEYFRGERTSPLSRTQRRRRRRQQYRLAREQYNSNNRLHPFPIGNHQMQDVLEGHEQLVESRAGLFEECLRRQQEIDNTGREITDEDRAFHWLTIWAPTPEIDPIEAPVSPVNDPSSVPEYPEQVIADQPTAEEGLTTVSYHRAVPEDVPPTVYYELPGDNNYTAEVQTLSFQQFIEQRGNTRPDASVDLALESDLDDYEHSYLGMGGGTAGELLNFRDLRRTMLAFQFDTTLSPEDNFDTLRREYYRLSTAQFQPSASRLPTVSEGHYHAWMMDTILQSDHALAVAEPESHADEYEDEDEIEHHSNHRGFDFDFILNLPSEDESDDEDNRPSRRNSLDSHARRQSTPETWDPITQYFPGEQPPVITYMLNLDDVESEAEEEVVHVQSDWFGDGEWLSDGRGRRRANQSSRRPSVDESELESRDDRGPEWFAQFWEDVNWADVLDGL